MLAFLCLYSLTFPLFLNEWFFHTLFLIHFWLPPSPQSLLLSLCLWSGIADGLGRHLSGEWASWFLIIFFLNPNLLLPPSRCTMHEEDTRDGFPCATRDCPQSISSQTDVIYQPLSEEATLRERNGVWEGGNRVENKEEQRNDQGGFWKAASRLKSDPTC